jgi:3',5'-cyclic AMP phosphodiesterase CpdA
VTLIAHLSDTHFGTEVVPVVEALVDILAALRPDVVVVSGDITQRARAHEFAAAKAFFQRLPAPVLVMPGNHDIPLFDIFSRAFNPYGNFRKSFGARTGAWHGVDASVYALDTTDRLRHTRGRVDLGQLARLAPPPGPRRIRVAAVHQPLHAAWAQDRDEVLLNARQAAQAFSDSGIDVVLSGHVHVPVITTTRELFPGLQRHFILAGAGTAVSHRTRPGAPNAFNLIGGGLLEAGPELRVQPFHYEAEKASFHEKAGYRFRIAEGGWTPA